MVTNPTMNTIPNMTAIVRLFLRMDLPFRYGTCRTRRFRGCDSATA